MRAFTGLCLSVLELLVFMPNVLVPKSLRRSGDNSQDVLKFHSRLWKLYRARVTGCCLQTRVKHRGPACFLVVS